MNTSYENVPVYDGNGRKYYFSLTIKPEDSTTDPPIVFYTYIHIAEQK